MRAIIVEEPVLIKTILEIGVAGGIAFYLLAKTTTAIKDLADAINKLADRVDQIDNRVNYFEVELRDIKNQISEIKNLFFAGRENLR